MLARSQVGTSRMKPYQCVAGKSKPRKKWLFPMSSGGKRRSTRTMSELTRPVRHGRAGLGNPYPRSTLATNYRERGCSRIGHLSEWASSPQVLSAVPKLIFEGFITCVPRKKLGPWPRSELRL